MNNNLKISDPIKPELNLEYFNSAKKEFLEAVNNEERSNYLTKAINEFVKCFDDLLLFASSK